MDWNAQDGLAFICNILFENCANYIERTLVNYLLQNFKSCLKKYYTPMSLSTYSLGT
jgi:hypothetical protein